MKLAADKAFIQENIAVVEIAKLRDERFHENRFTLRCLNGIQGKGVKFEMGKATETTPNWPIIQTEYISTQISYRELADKYNIPFRTITDRGSRENWGNLRKTYRETVVNTTVKKLASRASSRAVDKLLKLQSAADNLVDAIDRALRDTEQFNRHLFILSDGANGRHVAECIEKKVDTRAIRNMSTAIKDLTATIRNLYHIPTESEKLAMYIALKRLELDEAKASRGCSIDSNDNLTGVVEIAARLPMASDEAHILSSSERRD